MTAFWVIAGLIFGGLLIFGLVQAAKDAETMRTGTPEQKAAVVEQNNIIKHGPPRPVMVCPHCQEKGNVYCKAVKNKKGISGGKATGALLTGGVSMLATGLSRKEGATEAYCENCTSTWQF